MVINIEYPNGTFGNGNLCQAIMKTNNELSAIWNF